MDQAKQWIKKDNSWEIKRKICVEAGLQKGRLFPLRKKKENFLQRENSEERGAYCHSPNESGIGEGWSEDPKRGQEVQGEYWAAEAEYAFKELKELGSQRGWMVVMT